MISAWSREIADAVVVMQQGRVVESGTAGDVLSAAAARLHARPARRGAAHDPPAATRRCAIAPIAMRGRRARQDLSRAAAASSRARPARARGQECELRASARRDAGPGRRIRLGQIDGGAAGRAADRARWRHGAARRRPISRSSQGEELRAARRRIQMVFQDPFASLNPRRKVGRIIADGPIAHGVPRRPRRWRAPRELLALVGLDAGGGRALSRMNSPAGSASASASRARWRWSRMCWWPTSRSRRSTSRCRRRSWRCWRI